MKKTLVFKIGFWLLAVVVFGTSLLGFGHVSQYVVPWDKVASPPILIFYLLNGFFAFLIVIFFILTTKLSRWWTFDTIWETLFYFFFVVILAASALFPHDFLDSSESIEILLSVLLTFFFVAFLLLVTWLMLKLWTKLCEDDKGKRPRKYEQKQRKDRKLIEKIDKRIEKKKEKQPGTEKIKIPPPVRTLKQKSFKEDDHYGPRIHNTPKKLLWIGAEKRSNILHGRGKFHLSFVHSINEVDRCELDSNLPHVKMVIACFSQSGNWGWVIREIVKKGLPLILLVDTRYLTAVNNQIRAQEWQRVFALSATADWTRLVALINEQYKEWTLLF